LRYPADSDVWKTIDKEHPNIAWDSRHMIFGIASDGFNPFGKCNSTHSYWPVVLIPNKFPPWLCMKASSLMLTLKILGYPGRLPYIYAGSLWWLKWAFWHWYAHIWFISRWGVPTSCYIIVYS
jgi:hypothetical protein